MIDGKTCPGCKIFKTREQFSKARGRKDGLQSQCKECNKRYREKDPEKIRAYLSDYHRRNPRAARDRQLRSMHKKSLDWYEETLESQGGGCAICGRLPRDGENFHVDHDHRCCPTTPKDTRTCGECVRGILCPGCNTGIGKLKDDVRILENAIRYLEEHKK